MLRAFLLATVACAVIHAPCQAELDFVEDVRPILQKHCYACHGETKQKSGLRLDVKSEAFKGGDGYGPSLVAGHASESPLIELISSEDEDLRMPPEGKPLSNAEILTLTKWVDAGAKWPDGVDLVELEDPLDHWSFKPSTIPDVPQPGKSLWGRGAIDRFILSRLQRDGLQPAPPADATTWLRRVTLDLTGLPATPQEINDFRESVTTGEAAYTMVVDRLLKSPRYGERWAQHWLDVVRYADTHGFEVNTERPNAWPYRDYVIEALNNDTPYDQFVKEQIAGDTMGAGAATGFLVTASVLLPGQIGKDAPSIRLARQDALDEIVNNIGQTFLGLSVGCARCHDHKFDPISAKDYYSMQAFVAGVEYADRDIESAQADALRKRAATFRKQIKQIDLRLSRLVPLANPTENHLAKHKPSNAKENIETFAPLEAKFVRLTIHDSNLHPSLGLIEPCIDEFEILTDEPKPMNVAASSQGTKVTASGSRTSANHKLQHINDGQYGNSRSWMSDAKGSGWVMFELPAIRRIGKVVWSRDREGRYTDRLPTAFTLEAGPSLSELRTLAHVPPKRPPIRPAMNTDRFKPVRTSKLRFEILASDGLEPCIDELEVFNTAGQNIALESAGTLLRTSGDKVALGRHEPRRIHDGIFGNSSSWISSTSGKGWVELEFTAESDIDRVVWSRDREGKFTDRLATGYQIKVAVGSEWKLVADSSDRRPWKDASKIDASAARPFTTAGLSPEETRDANRLLKQQQELRTRIEAAQKGQKAFAGKFRKPDEIQLLRRGDPEQPVEPVTAAVLSAIGDLSLPVDATEQQRRQTLANWITRPENPLTARVMVNRIWQWHFGIGLVETANDFGRNGSKPSHSELLDWLAQEFIRSGWSIKHMHRLIVLSSTYGQSTKHNAKAHEIDANVRLLWRYPSRRLEAEAIRDSMLAVSGQLNLKMNGRGFDLFNKRGGLSGFIPVESFTGEGLRRMIYAHKVRRERDAVFGAFDCPDAGQSMARRIESTTPIQALNLFNSRLTIEQARNFSHRIESDVGDDTAAQIQRAYTIALGREPASDELSEAIPVVQSHGLQTLCRVLFNSNEFLFLP